MSELEGKTKMANELSRDEWLQSKKKDIADQMTEVMHSMYDWLEMGYNAGLLEGFSSGHDAAHEKGYSEGYKDGVEDEKTKEDGEYQRGLEDAWRAAIKLLDDGEKDSLTAYDLDDIFGCENILEIMKFYSASDVISKMNDFEQRKKVEKANEALWEEYHENGTIDYRWQCSACKQFSPSADTTAFCPSCGAKMKRRENHD